MPTGPLRLVFTGGSGLAGGHLIPQLLAAGHSVLNLDIRRPSPPLPSPIHTIITDLTDSGQVFNALTSQPTLPMPERWPDALPSPPDAIIHFAGFSTPQQVPDNETFRTNVLGMHNVIEAACKLGVKKIIIASSVTVYGGAFVHGDARYADFPIDEETETRAENSYALSKVAGEEVARSFAMRFDGRHQPAGPHGKENGVDIYVLRIARITTPEDYNGEIFKSYIENPGIWAPHGWSYTDIRDLGHILDLCLQKDGLGWQVFNATNDGITNWLDHEGDGGSTEGFLKRMMPNVKHKRRMGKREAPLSNEKIKRVLGFKEEWDWRELVPGQWRKTDSKEEEVATQENKQGVVSTGEHEQEDR